MKQQRASRSSLFLMELILTILFFSLSSAVCMQLFAKAHLISRDTGDLSAAVPQAQSAAALVKSTGGNLADIQEYYPGSTRSGSILTVFYDASWQVCTEEQAEKTMQITLQNETNSIQARISLSRIDDGAPCYELEEYLHRSNTF